MSDLQGRVIPISGGARGLDEAQARGRVAAGAWVVIGDVLVAEGQLLTADLGADCTVQPLDTVDGGLSL